METERDDSELQCRRLIITFNDGEQRAYPLHVDGDWRYAEKPDRVVIRPHGRGVPRHEIPLWGIHSIMLVPTETPSVD